MRSERFLFEKTAPDLLEGDISRGEVSHSYLIYGPRGIGSAELAERFATAVNCTGKRKGPLGYCGKCASCSKMKQNVLVDFNVKRPTRAVRRERGVELKSSRASIKIDDVREMIEDIYMKPNEARRKFWVLEEVQTMEERMLNSLLKILEEPPGDSVIVLTADAPDDLLPTVISRCKQVKMLRPSPKDMIEWIRSERGLEEDKAALVAKTSDYLPGRAMAIADDPYYWPLRETLIGILTNAIFEGGIFAAQRAADQLQLTGALALEKGLEGLPGPADPDSEAGRLASGVGIMDFIATFLKDIVCKSMGASNEAVSNPDREHDIAKLAGKSSREEWLRRAGRASELAASVAANANFRLALDEAMFLVTGDSIRKDARIC